MRALAGYIMRGPLQAMLVTAALALAALVPVLGVVSILSGAAIGLVTLRQGAKQGMTVLLGAAVISGLFLSFIVGTLAVSLLFVLGLWLPVWGLALALRKTASWSILLDISVALGVAMVALFYMAVGDPVQFWIETLGQVINMMETQGGADFGMFEAQLPAIAEWMTGMLAASLVMSFLSSLMVGRWWQAVLYNPGGFREEFQTLRLSRIAAFGIGGLIIISALNVGALSGLAGDAIVIAITVYSLVGVALAHALVTQTGRHVGWLVAMYIFMFFAPPHVLMALAGAGIVDSWLDFRARVAASKPKGDVKRDDEE